MRYIFLFLLTIPFFFTACKEDDGPSDCETFKNTKGEIQLWQPAGEKETILVQAENNSVFAGTVIFKLNKQYDEIRWLINKDSNYTYTTKEVTLGFNNPLRTYTVSAIGTKFISSKECGTITYYDTINSSFRTFKPSSAIGLIGKQFEIESTQFPGEKWTFHFKNIDGPINDYPSGLPNGGTNARSFPDRSDLREYPPYLIAVNFPRYENDSFIVRSIFSDGYTYFEGRTSIWDSIQPYNGIRIANTSYLKIQLKPNSDSINGYYAYYQRDKLTDHIQEKIQTFKGIAK